MSRYDHRSGSTELIDNPGIAFADWEICLKELDIINTRLGGHRITISGVKKLMSRKNEPLTIAEIGCGGGDNLKAIHKWNKGHGEINFIGIDLNQACTDFAAVNCRNIPAVFIRSDYNLVQFQKKPDIIFSSLFCHHFSDDQLVSMLGWLKKNAIRGFFINDLQRHPVAYHSIKLLTKIFSKSYLVKNDAPVSVLRGFTRRDWKELFIQAGIQQFEIEWKWAFRYLITVRNEQRPGL